MPLSPAQVHRHAALAPKWSAQDDCRLLQLRNENELPWERIAGGVYLPSTELVWLMRRYTLFMEPIA